MDTIYSKLKGYGNSDYYPYHMPGHKRKRITDSLNDFADIDITEIYDFDNLSDPSGILKDAQDSLADYLGVQKAYYLVNGSTVGILTAISAAVPKNGKLLIARNAHKSTYHAMCVRDIEPSYIYPNIIEGMNIFEAVTPDQVAKALAADRVNCFVSSDDEEDIVSKPIDAVIVVSPTYEGRIADIKSIAEVVHSYGIPLIVDEAHGAHLGFTNNIKGFESSACRLGADIVIQSLHKTIPSPTQTAVMLVNSELVDISRIEKYLHVYQTSSPSYVLMAAMEASINYMKEQGKDRLIFLRNEFARLVDDINSTCIYIEALPYVSGKHDPGKFIFSAKKAGLTGKQLTDLLRTDYHLEFEMNVREYVLAMFTVADEKDAYDRLRSALIDIDHRLRERNDEERNDQEGNKKEGNKKEGNQVDGKQIAVKQIEVKDFISFAMQDTANLFIDKCAQHETVYPMSVAWEMSGEYVELKESAGFCANEFIGLYPPGTPILVPGEKITEQHVEDLLQYIECGYEVTGIFDCRIKVIK